jgi:hypothetical protein
MLNPRANSNEAIVKWKFDEIAKPKICPVCGVVSAMPEKDKSALLETMKNIMMNSWLAAHAEAKEPLGNRPSTAIYTCISL